MTQTIKNIGRGSGLLTLLLQMEDHRLTMVFSSSNVKKRKWYNGKGKVSYWTINILEISKQMM